MPSPCILIVEDDAHLRKTLHDILALKGYTPVSAASGQAALAAAQNQPPAAAVIDLKLADISGLEVLRQLKALSPAIECLMVTGYASQASAIEAVNLGAYSYFQKPYNIEQLLTILHRALERREAAEALRASEARYRSVVDTSPDGVTLTDLEGKLIFCNQQTARLQGYESPAAMYGINVFEFIVPEDRPLAAQNAQKTLEEGSLTDFEYTLLRRDGSRFPAELSAAVIRNADGAPTAFLGITRDITRRKQMEAALREERALLAERVAERTAELSAVNAQLARAMRAKDEFLASMSHELRTPLSGILNLAELLQMSTYGSLTEKQVKAVGTIYDSGQHLLRLINDVLDLAKVEAGKLELQLQTMAVQDVCDGSLQLIRELAFKKGQRVAVAYDPCLKTIHADSRRLKQILVNLLVNAVKFTPDGGEIGLKVAGDEKQGVAHFTVWDTGIGIAPEDQPRLFKSFSQIDSSLTREYAGTGLGLALVRSMVELHGGSVAVASEGVPGKGSAFRVSLPWAGEELARALEDASPASTPPQSPEARSADETAPLILLADDSAASVSILSDFLITHCAYRVLVAQNGVEAVRFAWEQRPALILMDIQMPKLDGLEAIGQIRARPELAQLPIIALTALTMPGDRERCLAAGANDYLSKPVHLEKLATAIKEWVGRYTSRPGE